jgi:hypothetical protein
VEPGLAGCAAYQAAQAAHGYTSATVPKAVSWCDRNGDANFQIDEFTFTDLIPGPGNLTRIDIDTAWNVLFGNTHYVSADDPVCREVVNLAPDGAPAPWWDLDSIRALPATLPPELSVADRPVSRASYRDEKGYLYQSLAARTRPDDDWHGVTWPTYDIGMARFARWDHAGKLLWSTGRHAWEDAHKVLNPTPAGQIHYPTHISGDIFDCIIFHDRTLHPATAWTRDGLYAGYFLDRRVEDGLPGEV